LQLFFQLDQLATDLAALADLIQKKALRSSAPSKIEPNLRNILACAETIATHLREQRTKGSALNRLFRTVAHVRRNNYKNLFYNAYFAISFLGPVELSSRLSVSQRKLPSSLITIIMSNGARLKLLLLHL
jgi:hypothetical protein